MAAVRCGVIVCALALISSWCAAESLGQEADALAAAASDMETRLDQLEQATADAALAGHNAWMLVCTALVLFMTAPGLAMFYSGLVRKKNVLGVMMQCIFLMGLMTVVWVLWGYSFSFGGDGAWFGDGEYLAFNNVARGWDSEAGEPVTPMFAEGDPTQIPLLTHALFQGMFFIITPALICGAFAERMKFSAMVVFMVLWGSFVYCPLCHWVWDGGILGFVTTEDMQAGQGNGIFGGALDFAGGTVVHISSGVSALICALMIGRRLGFGSEPMPPHNLTYTALGTSMLWVGWFGFNAGSELASDGLASSAFAVTHFSAAAGAVVWAVAEWVSRGKPTLLGACSGAVAGLVCITPAAGFVNPVASLVMGAAAGVVCFLACTVLKNRFKYDDSLDAFGVHGVGGTLGAILTGVFATRVAWNIDNGNTLGLIEGGTRILVGQIAAVIVTWIFAAAATFVLLKIVDVTIGLRVSQQQEIQGIDLSEHGEEGYIFV
jgi:Amt family ammonium transporter